MTYLWYKGREIIAKHPVHATYTRYNESEVGQCFARSSSFSIAKIGKLDLAQCTAYAEFENCQVTEWGDIAYELLPPYTILVQRGIMLKRSSHEGVI